MGGHGDNSYADGYRTSAEDSTGDTDLSTWPPWSDADSDYDYRFWIRSALYCP
jgi:hypothetical protein